VDAEVVGIGDFLLVILLLQLEESHFSGLVENFSWVYAIIGVKSNLGGAGNSLANEEPASSSRNQKRFYLTELAIPQPKSFSKVNSICFP